MFIYIVTILLLLLFIIKYGNKKGFNQLETYWISLTILFYMLFYNLNNIHRIALLFMVFNYKSLLLPIYTITGIVFTILGQKFKTYRLVCLTLYKLGLNVKMNGEKIPTKPTIYIANYPSNYIEYLVHGLFCDKFCLLVYGPAVKILKHLYGEDHLIAVNKGSFNIIEKQIKDKIKNGYSIFSYIEKDYYNRKNMFELCELRTGIFSIAHNLNVTITPVCVDHIHHIFGIPDNNIFKIKIGETVYVEDPEVSLKNTREFLKYELRRFKIPKLM